MAVAPELSPFEALRRSRHASWLAGFIERLELIVAAGNPLYDGAIEIYLFGSRARGDWDGYSDVDLLVVADDQASAERWADRLLQAGVGSDVVALSRSRWEAMPSSPSPHWREVRTQATLLLRWPP
jgi:predicted nucleotidyltransferase